MRNRVRRAGAELPGVRGDFRAGRQGLLKMRWDCGCNLMRLLLLTACVVAGCDPSLDRPIHFVIPDGFSGPFVIVSNPSYPDAIVKYTDRYEVTVPLDGVFRTNNIAIFQRWHTVTAAYESGKRLPADEPNLSAFHSGYTSYGSDSDNTSLSWHYVGSYDDFKAFLYDGASPGKSSEWLEKRGITD